MNFNYDEEQNTLTIYQGDSSITVLNNTGTDIQNWVTRLETIAEIAESSEEAFSRVARECNMEPTAVANIVHSGMGGGMNVARYVSEARPDWPDTIKSEATHYALGKIKDVNTAMNQVEGLVMDVADRLEAPAAPALGHDGDPEAAGTEVAAQPITERLAHFEVGSYGNSSLSMTSRSLNCDADLPVLEVNGNIPQLTSSLGDMLLYAEAMSGVASQAGISPIYAAQQISSGRASYIRVPTSPEDIQRLNPGISSQSARERSEALVGYLKDNPRQFMGDVVGRVLQEFEQERGNQIQQAVQLENDQADVEVLGYDDDMGMGR